MDEIYKNLEEKINEFNIPNGNTVEDLISNLIHNSCAIEGNHITLPDMTELLFGGLNYNIVATR